jgi:phosphotransferase system enzyme I (PtsI)
LIDMTVTAAHTAGLPVAVCGEAAGDPASIALLLDLGVDELSVGSARLPEVRERVHSLPGV